MFEINAVEPSNEEEGRLRETQPESRESSEFRPFLRKVKLLKKNLNKNALKKTRYTLTGFY